MVSDLRREGCICNADDEDRVKAVKDEIAAEKKREMRDKRQQERLTFDRRIAIWGIIIAILAIAVVIYLEFYK